VVGSKRVNEKQLKALAETEASHPETREGSHGSKIYKILSPEQPKNSAILNESRPQ
jgi:hypothetical protein